jgi:hypothetical protein
VLDVWLTNRCPKCNVEFRYEQYTTETIVCLCGARIEAVHECCYDEESGEEWCYDYVLLQKQTAPADP